MSLHGAGLLVLELDREELWTDVCKLPDLGSGMGAWEGFRNLAGRLVGTAWSLLRHRL